MKQRRKPHTSHKEEFLRYSGRNLLDLVVVVTSSVAAPVALRSILGVGIAGPCEKRIWVESTLPVDLKKQLLAEMARSRHDMNSIAREEPGKEPLMVLPAAPLPAQATPRPAPPMGGGGVAPAMAGALRRRSDETQLIFGPSKTP